MHVAGACGQYCNPNGVGMGVVLSYGATGTQGGPVARQLVGAG